MKKNRTIYLRTYEIFYMEFAWSRDRYRILMENGVTENFEIFLIKHPPPYQNHHASQLLKLSDKKLFRQAYQSVLCEIKVARHSFVYRQGLFSRSRNLQRCCLIHKIKDKITSTTGFGDICLYIDSQ